MHRACDASDVHILSTHYLQDDYGGDEFRHMPNETLPLLRVALVRSAGGSVQEFSQRSSARRGCNRPRHMLHLTVEVNVPIADIDGEDAWAVYPDLPRDPFPDLLFRSDDMPRKRLRFLNRVDRRAYLFAIRNVKKAYVHTPPRRDLSS